MTGVAGGARGDTNVIVAFDGTIACDGTTTCNGPASTLSQQSMTPEGQPIYGVDRPGGVPPPPPTMRFCFTGLGPLGFSLSDAVGGGVFISEVNAGGAADQQGMRVGSLVLELANGIDVRRMSKQALEESMGTLPRPFQLTTELVPTLTQIEALKRQQGAFRRPPPRKSQGEGVHTMPIREQLLSYPPWYTRPMSCPPWPVSNLIAYLRRLSDAFGWRYVATVLICYGINQGVGEALMFYAKRYYMLDNVGIDSKTYGQLMGFGDIPWQLKSLFGVLSDTVPIFGMHRVPYMVFAGVVGVAATSLLTVVPATSLSNAAYGLIFFAISLNFVMPDVMLDATVAERSKQRPEYAAELQALCWGAISSVGLPFEMVKGYMFEALGAKSIFAVCIGAAACVLVPACCGWIEPRPAHQPRGWTEGTRTVLTLCSNTWQHEHKRAVMGAALVVGLFSFALGLFNLLVPDWEGLTYFCLGSSVAMCVTLYLVLRPVDATLAGAVVYTFASRAVCPKSTVVFEWLHDPGPPSNRCWTEAACAALNATPAAPALSCGWAKARDYPCIDPVTVSWVYVAGTVALLLGVWFYVSLMQHWPFRRTFVVTQTLICAFSFFDLLWIRRVNRALGVSDSVWCLFGNETAQDFVAQLNQMPFMIYAAKLCPRGTEASMFALFMGLSNFGRTAGEYLGSSLLQAYGGVEAPEFENLEAFVVTACLMQAIPILMVPYLVPRGSPMGTAQEMGASRAIFGDGMPPEITSCCRDDIELMRGPRGSAIASARHHARYAGYTERGAALGAG